MLVDAKQSTDYHAEVDSIPITAYLEVKCLMCLLFQKMN